MSASPPRVKRPLFLQIALLTASLLFFSLFGLGFSVRAVNEDTLKRMAQGLQHLALEDVSRVIHDALRNVEDRLEMAARIIVDTKDPQNVPELLAALVSGSSDFDSLGIYDREGAKIDVIREGGSQTELPQALDAELLLVAEKQGSALAISGFSSGLVVVPIRAQSQVTGYAAAKIHFAFLSEFIQNLSIAHFPGLEAPILITDVNGEIHLPQGAKEKVKLPQSIISMLKLASTGSVSEVVKWDGEEQLITFQALPGRPLVIMVREPTSVVFASLAEVRKRVWIAVGVALALALVFSYLLALGVTRPIRSLLQQAKHLAERRFDQRVHLRSQSEIAVLAHALNQAAEELAASEARIQKEVEIRRDLSRYLPKEVVEEIVQRKQEMALGGIRKEITVLFADVVGFTPIAERLKPEDTVALLNELFTLLTEIVFRHKGIVDKFIGDSVMAIFGAPHFQPDHPQRAVECAEDMLRFLDVGNARWEKSFGVRIELALGIASGECVIGNIGSEQRMEYTAIGDTVNTAARLEAIARPNQILLAESTAHKIEGFELIDRGLREIPGKQAPIRVFEVVV
ncbi:MAG: HAMP domain-containing protein [Sandaracinaceae bacterium]|nr:HAMP domain-containing protein [Sandaracinaceae bacterium]